MQLPKNQLIMKRINNSPLMEIATDLPKEGIIKSYDNYCFFKIDDDYIDKLFPLLPALKDLAKPDYFEKPGLLGAHISVIYPEEDVVINIEDLHMKHNFNVLDVCQAQLGTKEYFVITVVSQSLDALRERYYLSKDPLYKGNKIKFHITIGTRFIKS